MKMWFGKSVGEGRTKPSDLIYWFSTSVYIISRDIMAVINNWMNDEEWINDWEMNKWILAAIVVL